MKKFWKTSRKAMLCVLLALCMSVTVILAPVSYVSATNLPTLSLGDTENFQWDGSEGYLFKIQVDSTDLYDLIITDNYGMGEIDLHLEDEYGNWTDYFYGEITGTPLTAFLLTDKEYYVYCSYAVNVEGAQIRADLTFELSQSVSTLPTVPLCDIDDSSALSISCEVDKDYWFKFTTTEAGDYTFNFDELHAYMFVANASEGEYEYAEVDTEYMSVEGNWKSKNKMVFTLSADTLYYFCIGVYGISDTRISITKNSKTIKNVIPIPPTSKLDCFGWNIETYFSYKVEYTDDTQDILSYDEAITDGVMIPYIYLVNQNAYLKPGGKQLVMVEGAYGNYRCYVEVEPLYEKLISQGQTYAIGEYNSHVIENIGYDGYNEEYIRLKVGDTGVYDFYANEIHGSSPDQMVYTNIVVLDARNNYVKYIAGEGYPLIAGEEYVVAFGYVFAEGETDDFWIYPKRTNEGNLFPDTYKGTWYYDAVTYANGAGMMKGYSNGNFGTSDSIQRQDFLVMLARMAKIEEGWYEDYNPGEFTDFNKDSYYAYAVNWGYESGIVTGYLDGRFGIGDVMTREQLVTFLYRYAQSIGHNVQVSPASAAEIRGKYADFGSVSDFAEDAILWAIDRGVIKGKTANTIVPQGNAQRCEVAQIMYNIFKNEIL